MTFQLHPQLSADTVAVTDLAVSAVLLMNDSRFPWLVLVPRRPDLREIHDLDARGRAALIEEVSLASQALQRLSGADKINVGALGNLVPQLHVHVVARSRTDAAWPGPVWGSGAGRPYDPAALRELRRRLAEALQT